MTTLIERFLAERPIKYLINPPPPEPPKKEKAERLALNPMGGYVLKNGLVATTGWEKPELEFEGEVEPIRLFPLIRKFLFEEETAWERKAREEELRRKREWELLRPAHPFANHGWKGGEVLAIRV